jgi:hypothetical protein
MFPEVPIGGNPRLRYVQKVVAAVTKFMESAEDIAVLKNVWDDRLLGSALTDKDIQDLGITKNDVLNFIVFAERLSLFLKGEEVAKQKHSGTLNIIRNDK